MGRSVKAGQDRLLLPTKSKHTFLRKISSLPHSPGVFPPSTYHPQPPRDIFPMLIPRCSFPTHHVRATSICYIPQPQPDFPNPYHPPLTSLSLSGASCQPFRCHPAIFAPHLSATLPSSPFSKMPLPTTLVAHTTIFFPPDLNTALPSSPTRPPSWSPPYHLPQITTSHVARPTFPIVPGTTLPTTATELARLLPVHRVFSLPTSLHLSYTDNYKDKS